MQGIALEVAADAVALAQPTSARDGTGTFAAELTLGAGVAAVAAVPGVYRQITAGAVAVRQARGAVERADALAADLVVGAGNSAPSAVVRVDERIDAHPSTEHLKASAGRPTVSAAAP